MGALELAAQLFGDDNIPADSAGDPKKPGYGLMPDVTPMSAQRDDANSFRKKSGSDNGAAARDAIDNENYTDEDRQKIYGEHNKRQYDIRDDYDPEQMRRNYQYYDNNHAKYSVRGPLNNRNFRNTLGLSRLVDKFNNTTTYVPPSLTWSDSNGQHNPAYYHKADKKNIETEESRMMRQKERLDELASQQDISLSGRVQAHKQELQEQADRAASSLAQMIGGSQVQIRQALSNMTMQLEYAQPTQAAYNEILQQYISDLSNATKSKAITWALNHYDDWGPAVVSMMLQGMGSVSLASVEDLLMSSGVLDGLHSATDRNQFLASLQTFIGQVSATQANYLNASYYAPFTNGAWWATGTNPGNNPGNPYNPYVNRNGRG